MKSSSVTNRLKGVEQFFPAVMFSMLYNVVLTFESVNEILCVTIQTKANDLFFLVVLFVFQ